MRGRSVATFGLLGALVLGGCAGSGAQTGDASPSPAASSPSATGSPAESETESAHAGHHHRDYSDFPIEIAVEPACVAPGGTVTVTVDTVPRSGVLYLAYYADDRSGATEPFGAGYGGNGGGYADESGTFVESWDVTEQAPAGPGRLQVLTLADDGEEFVDFAVAEPDEESC